MKPKPKTPRSKVRRQIVQHVDRDINCVNCGGYDQVVWVSKAKDKRPNGDSIKIYSCEDCDEMWKE